MVENLMGQRIHQKRKEFGYTMEELGAKVGVNKTAVNKWEKGYVTNIKQSTIKKLADIFGVDVVWLMGLDEWSENLIKVQNPMLRAGFKIKEPRKRKSDSELLRYVAEMSDDVSSAAVGEVVISPNRRRLSEAVQGMSEEQLEQIIKYAEFIKSQS